MRRAAFARRGAADHLGAVGDRSLRVERAVLASKTLADDLGVLADQDGHAVEYFRERLKRTGLADAPVDAGENVVPAFRVGRKLDLHVVGVVVDDFVDMARIA